MKGKITTQEGTQFQKFEVTLTIESIKEARLIYHLVNAGNIWEHIKEWAGDRESEEVAVEIMAIGLYNELRSEIERQDFRI